MYDLIKKSNASSINSEHFLCNPTVQSISDLYRCDEISVLIDEIRSLEPSSCPLQDIQDFEIAGSQTVSSTISNDVNTSQNGVDVTETDYKIKSNIDDGKTLQSWQSHNYRHNFASGSFSNVNSENVFPYCDLTKICTATGVLEVCFVVTCLLCLVCICNISNYKLYLFQAPIANEIRFLITVIMISLLITSIFIFNDIITFLMFVPANIFIVKRILYTFVGALYILSSTYVCQQAIVLKNSFHWVPKDTINQLLVSGVLGYTCALQALLLAFLKPNKDLYKYITSDNLIYTRR